MRITVRLFALLRDRAGVSRTILELTPGSSVAVAVESLAREFPAMETLLPRIGYAVNQSYVDRQTVLHDGDELALIPPVSGGC